MIECKDGTFTAVSSNFSHLLQTINEKKTCYVKTKMRSYVCLRFSFCTRKFLYVIWLLKGLLLYLLPYTRKRGKSVGNTKCQFWSCVILLPRTMTIRFVRKICVRPWNDHHWIFNKQQNTFFGAIILDFIQLTMLIH